ncbi:MAG: helix-turn-helix domain-containing protein, partial [Pseudomonadota bacterium]
MPDKKNHKGRKDPVPGDEAIPRNAPELGGFLRAQRENKGLTQDQVAEITRLRKHIIKDLEEENWDQLPAPVFVKGFIRSYAKTLGLNEKDILDRYYALTPVETFAPMTLLGAPKKGKKPLFWVILFLVLVGAACYVWRERLSSFRLPTISLEKIYPSKDRGVEKKHGPQNLEKTSPEAVKEKAGSDGLAARETGTGSEGAVEEAPMKKPETAHLSDVPVMEKPSETAVGSSAAALSVQGSSSQFPGRATTSPGFP